MKSLFKSILIAVSLFSVSALATPKVGEYADYALSIEISGQTLNGMLSWEYTQEDQATNRFMRRQTLALAGSTNQQVEEEWLNPGEAASDQEIEDILSNCSSYGGRLESVEYQTTQLSTCALDQNDEQTSGTVWIAKVPFGIAKLTSTTKANGQVVNLQIMSYKE